MAEILLLAGMGFGDEGKGSITDFLVREHNVGLVCRYNGGAQAAHAVVLADGRQHVFAQFGSGTFIPGCRTHLSRFMLVQPGSMLAEGEHLDYLGVPEPFKSVTIEAGACITTRFHMAVNRLREMHRDRNRHGSCGLGIGETVVDFQALGGTTLFADDMLHPESLQAKLRMLQTVNRAKVEGIVKQIDPSPEVSQEWAWLSDPSYVEIEAEICRELASRVEIVDRLWLDQQLRGEGTVIFEGAQGILLDQFVGFMPYCTRSTISFRNALELLVAYDGPITRLGVIRSYLTRHGAGPMPTEDEALAIPEMHNCLNPWQQTFRLGHFDMALFRYALEALGGVDEIVVTHMDKRPNPQKVCVGYDSPAATLMPPVNLEGQFRLAELLAKATPIYEPCYDLVGAIEEGTGKPVTLLSYGPTAADKSRRARSRT
jgi:adenylosuccinate synthase